MTTRMMLLRAGLALALLTGGARPLLAQQQSRALPDAIALPPFTLIGTRVYVNVRLTRGADTKYRLHASLRNVQNLVVYRNGLRQTQGVDYRLPAQIAGAQVVLTPIGMWSWADLVVCDFTQP